MNHAEFRHILTLELSAQKQHNSEYFGSNGKNGLFRRGPRASPKELFSTPHCVAIAAKLHTVRKLFKMVVRLRQRLTVF